MNLTEVDLDLDNYSITASLSLSNLSPPLFPKGSSNDSKGLYTTIT